MAVREQHVNWKTIFCHKEYFDVFFSNFRPKNLLFKNQKPIWTDFVGRLLKWPNQSFCRACCRVLNSSLCLDAVSCFQSFQSSIAAYRGLKLSWLKVAKSCQEILYQSAFTTILLCNNKNSEHNDSSHEIHCDRLPNSCNTVATFKPRLTLVLPISVHHRECDRLVPWKIFRMAGVRWNWAELTIKS